MQKKPKAGKSGIFSVSRSKVFAVTARHVEFLFR